MITERLRINRRRFLLASLALGASAALPAAKKLFAVPGQEQKHLVWVWEFASDGEPNVIGRRLRDNNLGIVLKTHDGTRWMSEFDKSSYAVSGPAQVAVLVEYYEQANIPFHAWAVVRGTDPIVEAEMAAGVLDAGARSLYLDLQSKPGFWEGTPEDAEAFGQELRRLQPDGHVVLSIEPHPWLFDKLPLAQFAAISNELAPHVFWRTFDTEEERALFAENSYPPPPEGVTPEFLVDASKAMFAGFNLPMTYLGEGATPDADEFRRFLNAASSAGAETISVWRYGDTSDDVLALLRDSTASASPAAPEPRVHEVQPGYTSSSIAETYGVSAEKIAEANGLADPDLLIPGQSLLIP